MTCVLFVGPRLATGGTERHLLQILPELGAAGFGAHLHVLERGGELEAELLDRGIDIDGPPAGLPKARRAFAMITSLVRRIRRLQPDIVHCFLPEPTMLGLVAALLAGHRNVIISRRSLAIYRQANSWLGRLELFLNGFAKAYLGNSQAVVAELIAECGQADKVGLIYNGVAAPDIARAEARAKLRKASGFGAQDFVIVKVANLIAYKGHRDLLEALSGIEDDLPENWGVVFIGDASGYGEELRHHAAALGLEGRCRFLGVRRDAVELMAGADLFVLASHQEGFSNALVEAMGLGLPIVATAVGGNCDAVRDGQSGLLVPVADAAALGEAIRLLATDDQRALAFGAAARERAGSLFSEDEMMARYMNLYRRHGAIGQLTLNSILLGGRTEPLL